MPNKRKSQSSNSQDQQGSTKRLSKAQIEKQICKRRLDALALEECQSKDDRFSPAERRKLLEAYDENGFQVFQDTKLLHRYFPLRRESDLKGLIQRLTTSLQTSEEEIVPRPLEEWEKICAQLMGNFAKDKKVNFDNVLSEALATEADKLEMSSMIPTVESQNPDLKPDYQVIMKSFAQLLNGKFPDTMRRVDALISINLFNHLNSVVDSLDLQKLSNVEDGTWFPSTLEEMQRRQEMALQGLKEIDGKTKKCPTPRDVEQNPNIEALCLELPKIKRITDVLNPLHINESLVSTLMELQRPNY